MLGEATPEDHIAWAVRRLGEGFDTPSLRVLAGLDPTHERWEIEPYFLKSLEEADLEAAEGLDGPRDAARIVRRLFEDGRLSAEQTVARMSALHRRGEYADPILGIWHDLEEELLLEGSGHEGVFYPRDAIQPLESAVRREWVLFDRALALRLPDNFIELVRCEPCGHVGVPKRIPNTFLDSVKIALPWLRSPPNVRYTCAECGSERYRGISDPGVRELWYSVLEAEASGTTG